MSNDSSPVVCVDGEFTRLNDSMELHLRPHKKRRMGGLDVTTLNSQNNNEQIITTKCLNLNQQINNDTNNNNNNDKNENILNLPTIIKNNSNHKNENKMEKSQLSPHFSPVPEIPSFVFCIFFSKKKTKDTTKYNCEFAQSFAFF